LPSASFRHGGLVPVAGLAGKITGPVSVTGYSLGWHLATAFNLMHGQETVAGGQPLVKQVINFNGAGLGTIGDGSRATMQSQLPQMIQYFADLRDQAGQGSGLDGIFLSDLGRQGPMVRSRQHWVPRASRPRLPTACLPCWRRTKAAAC
jgi:hypothetical protein